MRRWLFLISACSALTGGPCAAQPAPPRLRLLTLNLWQSKILLRERTAIVERTLRELRPHLAAFQEVSAAKRRPNVALTLARRAGLRALYRRSVRTRQVEMGVALLSPRRLRAEELVQLPVQPPDDEPRVALCARVRSPVGPVEVCNVHLSYRVEDGEVRARQLTLADAALRRRPPARLRVLIGDLNAGTDATEVRRLVEGEGREGAPCYVDAFAAANPGVPGLTWDNRNPNIIGWKLPDRRIDYVLLAGLRRQDKCEVPGVSIAVARIVLDRPDARGHYASDHYGLFVEIEAN